MGVDKNKAACEPNVNENENEKVFPGFQNEKVSPEVLKIKDITYKTLKKEGQLEDTKLKNQVRIALQTQILLMIQIIQM